MNRHAMRVAAALAIAACLFWRLGHAESDRPITLGQTIERAVLGNADLRRERLAVVRAMAGETQALGQFDLLLGSNLSLQSLSSCMTVDCLALVPSKPIPAGSLTLSRNLESGGKLLLSAGMTRWPPGLFAATDAGKEAPAYDSSLTLTFTHPLLRGLGTEIAQANLRKARIQADMAQLARQMRACNVVRDVVVSYWELAYATQDLAIRRSALELGQEQLHATQAMIAAGRLADADAASVERAIAERREDVASAEQSLLFRSLDLWRLLGQPPDARAARLSATDAPSGRAPVLDDAGEVEQALSANPQLRALRAGIALSQVDLATARSTLFPKLDFTGSVGPAGRRSTLGGSLGQLGQFGAVNWLAGLSFEMPVQNRAARGDMRMAEEAFQRANLDAEDFALQVRDLVLRAASNIRTTGVRVELGHREVRFAEQNLEAEKARFQAGRATNNDVLLRQHELKDAETRLLRASIDQEESEAALAAVTAEILERYGVVLKGL